MKFLILKSGIWLNRLKHCVASSLTDTERDVELLKPIEDVTIYEKESASFDAEISEEDIPGEWKLKGELLRPSPVSVPHSKLPLRGCSVKSLLSLKSHMQASFNNSACGFLNSQRREII